MRIVPELTELERIAQWSISSVGFLFTCLVSFSTSAYSITAHSIQEELHTSSTLTYVALSTFNIAFGVGRSSIDFEMRAF